MFVGNSVSITAIITAYQRIDQTLETIRRLQACNPPPSEILVHVDAGGHDCADAVCRTYPHIQVLTSETPVGPGGGRNKLIIAASNELIASFDDDSYPLDADFFARAAHVMAALPAAPLVAACILQRVDTIPPGQATAAHTASFGAGGVILRKTEFLAAGGFIPLTVAYGMEEEDLALRLMDRGRTLFKSAWLRVYHDTDLSHHASAKITSASISNLALLAYLRYPKRYWPYGMMQVCNRAVWCMRVGRWAGIASGWATIPSHLMHHRHLRKPVSPQTMRLRFEARRGGGAINFENLGCDDPLSTRDLGGA